MFNFFNVFQFFNMFFQSENIHYVHTIQSRLGVAEFMYACRVCLIKCNGGLSIEYICCGFDVIYTSWYGLNKGIRINCFYYY